MATGTNQLIQQYYSDLLFRPATDAELSWWSAQIASSPTTYTSAALQAAIMALPEAQIVQSVVRLYEGALGRAPDPAGLAYYVQMIEGAQGVLAYNATTGQNTVNSNAIVGALATVAMDFAASPEFKNDLVLGFVGPATIYQLYENMFHRAPELAATNYWVAQLIGGVPIGTIMMQIAMSPEAQSDVPYWLVDNFLQAGLAADTGGGSALPPTLPSFDVKLSVTATGSSTATFVVVTHNIPAGTVVPYSLGGLSATQLGGALNGTVTIGADGTATFVVTVAGGSIAGLTASLGLPSAGETAASVATATVPVTSGGGSTPLPAGPYILTTGIDNLTSDGAAETFSAKIPSVAGSTLNSGDTLTGGGGACILDITASDTSNTVNITGVTISAIQTVKFQNSDTTATHVDQLDLTNFSGVTSLVVHDSSAGVTFNNVGSLIPLTLNNVDGSGTITVTEAFAAATVAGNSDSNTVNLNGVGATNRVSVVENGIENLTLATSGGADIVQVVDTSLKTLTITGNQTVNLAISTGVSATTTTIDDGAATGNFTMSSTTGVAAGATIKGGSGTDTLLSAGNNTIFTIASGFDGGDIVTGSGSNNTLNATFDSTSSLGSGVNFAHVTGIKTLNLTFAGAQIVDVASSLGGLGTASAIKLTGSNSGAVFDEITNRIAPDDNGTIQTIDGSGFAGQMALQINVVDGSSQQTITGKSGASDVVRYYFTSTGVSNNAQETPIVTNVATIIADFVNTANVQLCSVDCQSISGASVFECTSEGAQSALAAFDDVASGSTIGIGTLSSDPGGAQGFGDQSTLSVFHNVGTWDATTDFGNANDSLTINLNDQSASPSPADFIVLDVDGVENLTFKVAANHNFVIAVAEDNNPNAQTWTVTGGSGSTLTVTGNPQNYGFNKGTSIPINVNSIDASGFAGNFIMNITGFTGAANIKGGSGNDVIELGNLADTLDGGSGTNALAVAVNAAVTVDLRTPGSNEVSGGGFTGSATNFQNADLSNDSTGSIIIAGTATTIIFGSKGADTISTPNGLSTSLLIRGGPGADTISLGTHSGQITLAYDSHDVASGTTLGNADQVTGFVAGTGKDILKLFSNFTDVSGTSHSGYSPQSPDHSTTIPNLVTVASDLKTAGVGSVDETSIGAYKTFTVLDFTNDSNLTAGGSGLLTLPNGNGITQAVTDLTNVVHLDATTTLRQIVLVHDASNDVAVFFFGHSSGTAGVRVGDLSLIGVLDAVSGSFVTANIG